MALSISPPARHQLNNALIAFSLGTLCFIRRWYDLENLQARGLDYFRLKPPGATLLISTICSAVLLAAIIWAGWFWVERRGTPGLRKLAQAVFLLILIFPIESVRRYWNSQTDNFDWGSNIALWVVEIILAAGLIAFLLGNRRVIRPARRAVMLLLFLFPALMIDLLLNHLSAEQANFYDPLPALAMLPHGSEAHRVIWIIFDELDQHVAFDRRPADLELPELDRLSRESMVASQASQTSMWTAIALPSLISGRLFTNAQALDANDLLLLPDGATQRVSWRGEHNVFSRARELGVNTAIVGWHHPYCRIIGDEVTHCFAMPSTHSTAALAQEAHAEEDGILKTMASLYRRQYQNAADMLHSADEPGSLWLRDREIQRDQQQQYFRIRDAAYREAVDPRIGLLFVHVPAPHLLPIYNRREKNFTLRGPLDYLDNLALVDRTVGELRQQLEKAGLWYNTSILVTADHGLRPGAWVGRMGWTPQLDQLTRREAPKYVPYILKVAGEKEHVDLETPFSNVVSADMVLALLRGEVKSNAQAAAWVNQQAGTHASASISGAESMR